MTIGTPWNELIHLTWVIFINCRDFTDSRCFRMVNSPQKHINNTSNLNKGNDNWMLFGYLVLIQCYFYFSVFSLILVLTEKIQKTLETVFITFPNTLKCVKKYSTVHYIFNSLLRLSVWKCGKIPNIIQTIQFCFKFSLCSREFKTKFTNHVE